MLDEGDENGTEDDESQGHRRHVLIFLFGAAPMPSLTAARDSKGVHPPPVASVPACVSVPNVIMDLARCSTLYIYIHQMDCIVIWCLSQSIEVHLVFYMDLL